MNQKSITIILAVLALLVLMLLGGSFYTVSETEQVVITQFGRPVGSAVKEAGLKFKLPFIQTANYFSKQLLEWDAKPEQIPTKDKKFIWVDTFARWRIVDPLKFLQAVNNESVAQARLDNIIESATRDFVSTHLLIESVRNSNREMDMAEIGLEMEEERTAAKVEVKFGREKITREILGEVSKKVPEYGIEVEDVRIKRINYVEEVRKEVYERMKSERKRIAEKYRSEGGGESAKIEGDREKKYNEITSEAYRKAQTIMGKADAEATRIY
ncbi:MAG: protease modulator HflC, partial [Deltaproteobacteria bacterium]